MGTRTSNDILDVDRCRHSPSLLKPESLVEFLQRTGVTKICAAVVSELVPELLDAKYVQNPRKAVIRAWNILDPSISSREMCSPVQNLYLRVTDAKAQWKSLVAENRMLNAKIRMEKDGINGLIKPAAEQPSVEDNRKRNDHFRTVTNNGQNPDDAYSLIDGDLTDEKFRKWLIPDKIPLL